MNELGVPHIARLGEQAILVHWEAPVSTSVLYTLLGFKKQLLQELKEAQPEILNTYNSVLIRYPFVVKDFEDKKEVILKILEEKDLKKDELQVRRFTLPVCYHKSLGLDIEEVSHRKNISVEELVEKHTKPTYTIYFQGFLPGFLYLGGLDPDLTIPRKREPRLQVAKGAVGIAENQTGIYPSSSAGGWQIIGNCPVDLFDPYQNPPSPFLPGDKLKFTAISLMEYKKVRKAVEAAMYKIQVQSDQQ